MNSYFLWRWKTSVFPVQGNQVLEALLMLTQGCKLVQNSPLASLFSSVRGAHMERCPVIPADLVIVCWFASVPPCPWSHEAHVLWEWLWNFSESFCSSRGPRELWGSPHSIFQAFVLLYPRPLAAHPQAPRWRWVFDTDLIRGLPGDRDTDASVARVPPTPTSTAAPNPVTFPRYFLCYVLVQIDTSLERKFQVYGINPIPQASRLLVLFLLKAQTYKLKVKDFKMSVLKIHLWLHRLLIQSGASLWVKGAQLKVLS